MGELCSNIQKLESIKQKKKPNKQKTQETILKESSQRKLKRSKLEKHLF